ncbi:Protein disulfide-isomerase [Erysiphe neolycopersici]|uniref:Protein disulfide-isomerase n=1 Tax=Erysiphe neolycopersici TaxID=212602 RepID=A0A420I4B4_9PEZI|nr:Protein disulfide-isomerase [Erysiphe neolycopersici]
MEKKIRLVKIDCTEETELCKNYDVDGYPTLKIFRGIDNFSAYTGSRKAPGIVSHMVKRSLPAVSILDKDTLEDFKKADQVVLVAYLDLEDMTTNSTYTNLAEKLRETYLFGAIHDSEVAKSEGVTFPAIVLYKSFDENKVIHSGKIDGEEIETFAKTASTPLIGEIGPETFQNYMTSGVPIAYIFAQTEDLKKSLSDALRPVAEKYKGKVNFATIDASSYGGHAININLEADKFPAFAIHQTSGNKKFPFDQDKEIITESIEQFVSQYVDGKLEPNIKSEPIPESQDGPVKVVVAKNFDEIVMDDSKDVILEFYAPWCGYCKALAPKYNTLGQLYIDANLSDKVTVAKIDATANDFSQDIEGFPTIMLFKAGDKQNPITYDGDRNIEELIAFVKKGTHEASVEYTAEMKEKDESSAKEKEDEKSEEIHVDDDEDAEVEEHDEL